MEHALYGFLRGPVARGNWEPYQAGSDQFPVQLYCPTVETTRYLSMKVFQMFALGVAGMCVAPIASTLAPISGLILLSELVPEAGRSLGKIEEQTKNNNLPNELVLNRIGNRLHNTHLIAMHTSLFSVAVTIFWLAWCALNQNSKLRWVLIPISLLAVSARVWRATIQQVIKFQSLVDEPRFRRIVQNAGDDIGELLQKEKARFSKKESYIQQREDWLTESIFHLLRKEAAKGDDWHKEACYRAVLKEISQPATMPEEEAPPTLSHTLQKMKEARTKFEALNDEQRLQVQKIINEGAEAPAGDEGRPVRKMIKKIKNRGLEMEISSQAYFDWAILRAKDSYYKEKNEVRSFLVDNQIAKYKLLKEQLFFVVE